MLEITHEDNLAIVSLHHGKVNLLDLEMLQEIIQQFDALARSETGAVVLTGEGATFSAGVDLVRVVQGGKSYLEEYLPLLIDMLYRVFTFNKPTVAAINGHAIAGGCVLAAACDYRIMAEGDGIISVAEMRVGVPFPSLPLEVVRLAVPAQHLKRIVLRAESFSPQQALDIGLVDEVVPADELRQHALRIANEFARIPAESFALTKRLIQQPALDRYARYKEQIDAQARAIWSSDAMRQRLRSYLERSMSKGD